MTNRSLLVSRVGDYWTDLNFLSRADKGFPMKIQLVKIPVVLEDGEQSGADVDGAYTLKITKKGITLLAAYDLGVFYGIQTLRQIMENPSVEGGKKLPCLEIRRCTSYSPIVVLLRVSMVHHGRTQYAFH